MNSISSAALLPIASCALIVAYASIFTVYQTRQAIVVRLGEPVDVITRAGTALQVRRSSTA